MPLHRLTISLRAATPYWRRQENFLTRHLPHWAKVTLQTAQARPDSPGEIALLLTSNAEMRKLNRVWRGKDSPTNVLSFPARAGDGRLGDIALASPLCQKEAKQNNMLERDYVCHLVIHAILHLIGYDHATDKTAEKMEEMERRVLLKLGKPLPPHLQE